MSDPFLSHWFKGFEAALERMDEESRKDLLAQCGRACSASHTRRIYVDEYRDAIDLPDFIARLKTRFPESDFCIAEDGNTVELTYRYCACDLVTNGYLKTPLLCECSRQSLQDNWEAALGSWNIQVELIHSILGGNACCRFRIHIPSHHIDG